MPRTSRATAPSAPPPPVAPSPAPIPTPPGVELVRSLESATEVYKRLSPGSIVLQTPNGLFHDATPPPANPSPPAGSYRSAVHLSRLLEVAEFEVRRAEAALLDAQQRYSAALASADPAAGAQPILLEAKHRLSICEDLAERARGRRDAERDRQAELNRQGLPARLDSLAAASDDQAFIAISNAVARRAEELGRELAGVLVQAKRQVEALEQQREEARRLADIVGVRAPAPRGDLRVLSVRVRSTIAAACRQAGLLDVEIDDFIRRDA